MLAKDLEKVQNKYGTDFSEWDYSKEFDKYRNVKAPYTLILKTDVWVGNFERELIGYAFGILDGVQMQIEYAIKERTAFWQEVFGKEEPCKYEADYELLTQYLFETFQTVDDWEQITFYNLRASRDKTHINDETSELLIQFASIPPIIWRNIFIKRIKNYFEKYPDMTKNGLIKELYFVSNENNEDLSSINDEIQKILNK
jgi:hypothetical protein